LVPFVANAPFFKDRGMNEAAISSVLSLMSYKDIKRDEFVIEHGQHGDEFYLILEGECEVLVPDKQSTEFKEVTVQMRAFVDQVDKAFDEVHAFNDYRNLITQQQKRHHKVAK